MKAEEKNEPAVSYNQTLLVDEHEPDILAAKDEHEPVILAVNTNTPVSENNPIEKEVAYLKKELDKYLIAKENAVGLFKANKFAQALDQFNFLKKELEVLIKHSMKNKCFSNPVHKEIQLEFLRCNSNRAQMLMKLEKYEEAIEIDKTIVTQLDPFFDKAYARIIEAYITLGKVNEAHVYGNLFRTKLDPVTVAKYDWLVIKLKKFLDEAHNNSHSKTTTEESRIENESKDSWSILGWALVVGSTVGLGLLYAFRNNFKI